MSLIATTAISLALTTTPALAPDCKHEYKAKDYKAYAASVYRRPKISKRAAKRLEEMRRCQRTPAGSKRVERERRRLLKERKVRLAYEAKINALTPYPGPGGTRWAVPWAIVNCERDKRFGISGIWRSHNPSGALGPYQLLGHGAPWPANTPAKKAEHHRIAGNLFKSQGYGPWTASKGCWG